MKFSILAVAVCFLGGLGASAVAAEPPLTEAQFESDLVSRNYADVPFGAGPAANEGSVICRINGVDVTMMVDTGTPLTCLSADCAARLHLVVYDSGRFMGGAGGDVSGHVGVTRIQKMTMPFGRIIRPSELAVFPSSAGLARGMDGVLGLDILEMNAAIYPVGGHGLLFKPGSTPQLDLRAYMAQAGFRSATLSSAGGHLWVESRVNGRPLRLMVDTGAEFTGFRLAAIEAALGQKLATSAIAPRGFDGRVTPTFSFTPATLEIGGVPLPPSQLLATDLALFQPGACDGLLGVDVMTAHQAVIDLGDMLLWLK